MIRAAAVLALVVLLGAPDAQAQGGKPDAHDAKAIQDCLKSHSKKPESCIGLISNPCLERDDAQSTAGMVACIARETAVWDDILNETYRRLRGKLDPQQRIKLRDMQRVWIVSRDKTCAFYWDYFQGTMASPMSADCVNTETARRALFLLNFLDDAEGK